MAQHIDSYHATFRLAGRRSSVARARPVLHAVLGSWGVEDDVVETGELVLSELVTNALRVPDVGDPSVGVRIARRAEEGLLRLEVTDGGGGRPEIRSPSDDETGGRGLILVAALAHRWAWEARADGRGKTVWAELKATGMPLHDAGEEVAAVAVLPGQCVCVHGAWHEVRSVRSKRYVTGGLAVLLALDDGRTLRLHAGEPVRVRDRGASSAWGGEDAPQ